MRERGRGRENEEKKRGGRGKTALFTFLRAQRRQWACAQQQPPRHPFRIFFLLPPAWENFLPANKPGNDFCSFPHCPARAAAQKMPNGHLYEVFFSSLSPSLPILPKTGRVFFLSPLFNGSAMSKKKYTSPKGPARKGQKSAEFQVVYGRRVTQPFSSSPHCSWRSRRRGGKILKLDRGKLVLEKSFFSLSGLDD